MHSQNHRYGTWRQANSFRGGRRDRRNWQDFDQLADHFMGTGAGKLLTACGLGAAVGLAYSVIFGLSFFEAVLFLFLTTALSIGLTIFMKGDAG